MSFVWKILFLQKKIYLFIYFASFATCGIVVTNKYLAAFNAMIGLFGKTIMKRMERERLNLEKNAGQYP